MPSSWLDNRVPFELRHDLVEHGIEVLPEPLLQAMFVDDGRSLEHAKETPDELGVCRVDRCFKLELGWELVLQAEAAFHERGRDARRRKLPGDLVPVSHDPD
jgi:hypothetical protein